MRRAILFFCAVLFISGCGNFINDEKIGLRLDDDYPKWLSDGAIRTNQTSGIAFISSDKSGSKIFLLADDIGELHLLEITKNGGLKINGVKFVKQAKGYFDGYPKKDFEEVCYNKSNGAVYLSVEGNGKNFLDYTGIFKLHFKDNNVLSGEVEKIEKLNITPLEEFNKHVDLNVGYEGIAHDKNYLYLGLEGVFPQKYFSDRAYLYVVDKKTLAIKKVIDLKPYEISTVCGLYSQKNKEIWGVDRNMKKAFRITLDDSLKVAGFASEDIETRIPNYHEYGYMASLESITMDDEGSVYMVDDPFTRMFVPPDNILAKLDSNTVSAFKTSLPIIYKFSIQKK
ncbi:MAG TPA: hypothetical protein VHP30_14285 [Ignavibacteriales bacterium]|nr:hypothetical protein [Ignavibacteriales bacterium]